MDKTSITVKIYNEDYTLRTTAPQAQAIAVANSVDERMRKLSEAKNIQSREKLAVWTALDLAADLYELQQRYDRLLAAVKEK